MEQKQCSLKDARILLMNEILQGIKVKFILCFCASKGSLTGYQVLCVGEAFHEEGGRDKERGGDT